MMVKQRWGRETRRDQGDTWEGPGGRSVMAGRQSGALVYEDWMRESDRETVSPRIGGPIAAARSHTDRQPVNLPMWGPIV